MVVQGIHETNVDQRTRPDHGCRLNEELPNGTGQAEAETLRRQGEDQIESPTKLAGLEVVELLERNNGIQEVTGTASESGISHCNDDDMLFDVEWARVEIRRMSEELDLLVGEVSGGRDTNGISNEQHDVGADVDDWIAQKKQGVDSRADGGHQKTDDPCSNGARGNIFIVVTDDGADLKEQN